MGNADTQRDEVATVLCLEDSELACRALRRQGEALGCRVVEATTVAAAEAFIAQSIPTALVVDVDLKDGTGPEGGLEFLWRVREAKITAPAVVFTGHRLADLTTHPEGLRAAFISKPANIELVRFLATAAKWPRLRPWLVRNILGHRDLDERHFMLTELYLFLGDQALPRAMCYSARHCYSLREEIQRALDIEELHLLWRELALALPEL